MMRTNENGRSMIEMLGVLAIVGVLSVGGIAGYSKAMAKFKTNKVIDQANMISTNIKTMYSSQRTYAGLDNGLAAKIGIVPAEMYDATNVSTAASSFQLNNAFGGNVVIKAANNVVENDSYVIAFDAIPAGSCITILTTDWGNDSGSGLQYIAVGAKASNVYDAIKGTAGTPVKESSAVAEHDFIAKVGGSWLPFSLPNATSICGRKGEVGIGWKYI